MEDGVLEDLNARLSPVERAYDAALTALLEDKVYFYQVSGLLCFWLATYEKITLSSRGGLVLNVTVFDGGLIDL